MRPEEMPATTHVRRGRRAVRVERSRRPTRHSIALRNDGVRGRERAFP